MDSSRLSSQSAQCRTTCPGQSFLMNMPTRHHIIVNAARCPPRPSRARSVCGSTASSRAGQVVIQAWIGSGVVGPMDVMGPQESLRQGDAGPGVSHGAAGRAALLGLVGEGPGLVTGWAGPAASLRHCSLQHVRLVPDMSGSDKAGRPLLVWVAGWASFKY